MPDDFGTAVVNARVSSAQAAPELAIIVPTFNERENVCRLVALIAAALGDAAWEVIFVDDDSTDGTAAEVRAVSQRDTRVRCIQRVGRRGLSSACIEGMLASSAPYIAVMDADLQHDERLLPQMLDLIKREALDVVVGSRYIAGGGTGSWDRSRLRISGFATRLARIICKNSIADPMSGFFMLRRAVLEDSVRRLSGQGFKILLDLLASSPHSLQVKELPFQFRERRYGVSKLDTLVAWEYIMLIADKLIGHLIPVRFVLFAMVGALGLGVHLAVLGLSLHLFGVSFSTAQGAAVITAMTFNFFVNNLFTYRDKRLKGWRLVRGLAIFYAICSLGATANVGIGTYVFDYDKVWWLAGIAGAVVGSVWNYAVSSVTTWKK